MALLGTAVVLGCGGPDAPARPVGTHPPRLVRVPLAITDADHPQVAPTNIAVTDLGDIVYPASTHDTPMYRVIDSTGRRVAAFGRRGAGPGEFGLPPLLYVDLDTIYFPLTDRGVTVRYDLTGSFVDESPPGGPIVPMAAGGDSVDEYVGRHGSFVVQRVSMFTNLGRQLFSSVDPFAASASRAVGWGGGRLVDPPYHPMTSGFVIGNGLTYQLQVYDANGRVQYRFGRALPPATRGPRARATLSEALNSPDTPAADRARLDTLDREIVPHFSRYALQIDGVGRLWVIGTSHDTTFADTFADSVFLGRQMLPCYNPARGIAMRGHWLALRCEADEASDEAYELQLYRIVN